MTRLRPTATITFVVLAVALAWLLALPLWLDGGLTNPLFPLYASAIMYTPAIAAAIVMLVMRPVPRGDRLRFLGIWPLRPWKRTIWLSVLAIIVTAALAVLSMLVASLFGWVQLDFVHFSGFRDYVAATLPAGAEMPDESQTGLLVLSQFLAIPFAAMTINAIVAFGEELGWRGFLVPALRPLGTWLTLILSGAIWGLWHAPLILLGYNFGRTDILGVVLMTVGCIFWGILLGWLRLRSGSMWPAVFAHGSMNAAIPIAMIVFSTAGTSFDPALASPLGVAGWIVCGVVTLLLLITGQFRKQPELGAARQPSSDHESVMRRAAP